MRRETKRSLLLWPAVASAAITAMSSLTMIDEANFNKIHASSVSLINHVVAMHSSIAAPEPEVELAVRHERGARAMKLPDRIAEVFGVDEATLRAPVRDEQSELAGLALPSSRHADQRRVSPPSALLSGSILAGDPNVTGDLNVRPDPNVTGESITTDQAIATRTLQSLRNRDHMEAIRSFPGFVGPLRPEPTKAGIEVLHPATLPQPSLLDGSNRLLGKRRLTPPKAAVIAIPQATAPRPEDSPSAQRVSAPAAVTLEVNEAAGRDMLAGETVAENRLKTERSPAGWPLTRRLDEQLETLSSLAVLDQPVGRDQLVSSSRSVSPIVRWSDDVSRILSELQSLPRLGDPQAGALIDRLSELGDDGERQAEELTDRGAQIQWLRASHGIARRVAVWRPVWKVTNGNQSNWMVSDDVNQRPIPIRDAIAMVRAELGDTGDAEGWEHYLLLEEIESASNPGQVEQRTILAQRFLSRLAWHGLDPEQQRWLKGDAITELAAAVLPWARRAVDYANLMGQIERQETDAIDLSTIEIADAVQTLRFAENPQAISVADAINTYYRNANIRLALSEQMLKRLLPTIDPLSVPVRTQIFGSRVRGTSQIESDLDVELKPSADQWSLELKTLGKVRTQSTGINGPVAIRTAGNSNFVAATPISVTKRGVKVGGSDVEVEGRTNLRGIRTEYDGWPLIGSLVRSIAENQYDSLSLRSNRIANQKIRSQVGSEINNQVDERLDEATDQLSRMVLGPLGKLRLDPKVMDMRTTEQRLLARYRLAGDWQLGAFTPRPRALSSSLMSVQVHQSALNNTLECLVPKGQPMTIDQMLREAAGVFEQTDFQFPAEIPENVTVRFAQTRPITVEIEDDQLWVTLRVVRLNRGDRVDLTNFIVRAAYRPHLDGLQATLVREGHLRISGPGMSMRERLPVRAIFNKVLSPNRPFHLTLPQLSQHPAMEGLAVSQLELRDGWIGLAISEEDAPRIATGQRRQEDL